jgi:hypothetical protein
MILATLTSHIMLPAIIDKEKWIKLLELND